MKKTEGVWARVNTEEKEAIEYLAEMDNISVSEFIRRLVLEKLEEEGYRG